MITVALLSGWMLISASSSSSNSPLNPSTPSPAGAGA